MCAAADEIRAAVQQNADGSDWHVWGGYWTDTEVCLYMDGVSLGCAATFDSTAQPMHLALTLARQPEGFVAQECTRLGLDPCPPPTPELWMEVDYVRIWQQTQPPPTTTTTAPPPSTTTTVPSSTGEGDVNFYLWAKSPADYFTSNPTQAQKDFMNANYAKALVFGPSASDLSGNGYWNSRLAWFSRVHEYLDAYAIKPSEIAQNPALDAYVLRDANGNRVYINYQCSGGTCPQYAADVSNPGYRTWFLGQIQVDVDHGYPGIFLDDVNMRLWFSNGSSSVIPIDPNTGQPLTTASWRDYFADFVELVRTSYPNLSLVHNTVWYVDQSPLKFGDADVAREIAASDYVMLEHGCNDPGLDASGTYSLRWFLDYADRVHNLGSNVIMNDEIADTPAQWEHNLACYFLVTDGGDMVGSEDYGTASLPGSIYPAEPYWWDGWDINLGTASGARYDWTSGGNVFIRRDFATGIVVTREPGLSSASFPVPAGYHRIDGTTPSTITLAGRQSVVLIADTPAPTTTTTTTTEPPTTTTTTTAPPTTTTAPCKPKPHRPCPP
jgi:hypothetical protein